MTAPSNTACTSAESTTLSTTLSAAEARDRMVKEVSPIIGSEFLPIRSALGRVLAADIIARHDVPAHDNSAMDGYAIRFDSLSGEGETRLAVVGAALAGNAFSGMVGKGQAVRIMTGAILPAGADTVVMQEITRTEECAGRRQNARAGRTRRHRIARHCRSRGQAPAAGCLLLYRRRAGVHRQAAGTGRGVRQQPLHAAWSAHPPRRRHHRHGGRAGSTRSTGGRAE
jgi:molybdopterin biosynthesis enzyme